jgi:rhodanese-related sulfurtransferase
MDSGTDMVVLDSRPADEFHRMTIPGAINVPGGELVYRIGDIAPDPATTIVINCAGRTRSIMGAESLRRAGVPNRIVALRNGTGGGLTPFAEGLANGDVTLGAARHFPARLVDDGDHGTGHRRTVGG